MKLEIIEREEPEEPTFEYAEADYAFPEGTESIGKCAFEGDAGVVVYIPDTCTTIGKYAFRNSAVEKIRIPARCSLGKGILDGCGNVYVFSEAGSEAAAYCESHDNCTFVEEVKGGFRIMKRKWTGLASMAVCGVVCLSQAGLAGEVSEEVAVEEMEAIVSSEEEADFFEDAFAFSPEEEFLATEESGFVEEAFDDLAVEAVAVEVGEDIIEADAVEAGENIFEAAEEDVPDELTVVIGEAEEEVIIKQPVDVAAAIGESVSFTVEAVGVLSYQWEVKADGEEEFVGIEEGADTDTLTFVVTEASFSELYRCVIVAEGHEEALYTDEVKVVYVEEDIPQDILVASAGSSIITEQPVDIENGVIGEYSYFTVKAENVEKYRWEVSKDKGETWEDANGRGKKTENLRKLVTKKKSTFIYRCRLTGEDGSIIYTDEVVMKIPAVIEVQPEDYVADDLREYAAFRIFSSNAKSLRWQVSKDGGETWYNCVAGTGVGTRDFEIKVTTNTVNYLYRCRVRGWNSPDVYSDVVKIAPTFFAVEGIFYKPLSEDEAVVIGYAGEDEELVVPMNVENEGQTYTVSGIGAKAFYGKNTLTSVEIPSTVTEIGDYAFRYCSALKKLY